MYRNCPCRCFRVSFRGDNLPRRLFGSRRLFLPEVPAREKDRGAPLHDAVIDSGMGQVGRVFDLFQFQVGRDDQRLSAPVPAVNDKEHLLQRIFGIAFHSQVVQDQKAVIVKGRDKSGSVLGKHPGQLVQDRGDIRHEHRYVPLNQGIGDASGKKGFPRPHIAKKQKAGIFPVCLLSVPRIGTGLLHERVLAVVIGKGEVMEITVLQAQRPPVPDALHERPLFLGGLPLPPGLLLAGADTEGHEVAVPERVGEEGLPPPSAFLTVDKAIRMVYVFVLR